MTTNKFTIALLLVNLPALSNAASGTFSYDPAHTYGPLSWAAADIAGNQCGGAAQSGIDIPILDCEGGSFDSYVFAPGSCGFDDMDFVLFPHAVQANYKNVETGCIPPRMNIPGQANPFEAVQFHIHTGSDHALGGLYFGADMHLVHREVDGDRFAVLGFFLEPTSPSDVPNFDSMLNRWETTSAATTSQCATQLPVQTTPGNNTGGAGVATAAAEQDLGVRRRLDEAAGFNPYNMIPHGSSIYTYDGSLTTPPCSEVVYWNVVDVPVTLSVSEYLRLANLIIDFVDPATCESASIAAPSGFTGRPVQAINGRTITRHCGPGAESGERVVAPPVTVTPPPPGSSAKSSVVSASALIMSASVMIGMMLML